MRTPSESAFGFLFSELRDGDTKLDGLGGVIFGVLLILFARFAPFGAVGTFRILRSRIVQIVPKPPGDRSMAGRRPRTTADELIFAGMVQPTCTNPDQATTVTVAGLSPVRRRPTTA